MKYTWKGIKSITSLQKTTNDSPKIISLGEHTVTRPQAIANTFNSFFCSVAAVQSEVPFSYNTFFEYLAPPNQDSFFISPCAKEEIIEIISNFKPKKSAGPNSIPTKILRLLKDDVSATLSIIFNISFATGIFSKKLKVVKVIPIHKKDSKLEFFNYRPISLSSNIDKILEKLMHKILMKFFPEQKFFISNNLTLGRIFPLPMPLEILLIVSKLHLTKTNLHAGLLLTSRTHLTQLIMRSCEKSCGIRE